MNVSASRAVRQWLAGPVGAVGEVEVKHAGAGGQLGHVRGELLLLGEGMEGVLVVLLRALQRQRLHSQHAPSQRAP